ncbi:hypothetical protein [Clostridium sp. FP1]|uniref:hypothetical protein n=1 Tax=Clostridium sp. FP1 TaxID=2724076 RepID=UPI0013E963E4|nr:hypothetical protein [Clostridium sp. FP1]MBZ9637617.1 hypothetical protein [Clostridium sp. FP1]
MNSKLLISMVTTVSILCSTVVPTFAATTIGTTLPTPNSTSTAMHSLATSALSISSITSNVGAKGTIGTLPSGNSLILWINANGGSGSYQYQIVVMHQNEKGYGPGTIEYISQYNSSSPVFYTPKSTGYYTVNVNVKDSAGAVVGTLFMPTGMYGTAFIDVE